MRLDKMEGQIKAVLEHWPHLKITSELLNTPKCRLHLTPIISEPLETVGSMIWSLGFKNKILKWISLCKDGNFCFQGVIWFP